MARIRTGDTVIVRSGKDRGKTGKVLRVWPTRAQALVQGLNLAKHFDRPTKENPRGGVIEREAPLALPALALVSPKTGKPARVSWRIEEGGKKVRLLRQTQEVMPSAGAGGRP